MTLEWRGTVLTSVAILDKVPPRGGNFEVPTLPGMASLRLATISRLTGICATSMKKESLSELLRCELVVVTRLVRLL